MKFSRLLYIAMAGSSLGGSSFNIYSCQSKEINEEIIAANKKFYQYYGSQSNVARQMMSFTFKTNNEQKINVQKK